MKFVFQTKDEDIGFFGTFLFIILTCQEIWENFICQRGPDNLAKEEKIKIKFEIEQLIACMKNQMKRLFNLSFIHFTCKNKTC
jgi:hypothetical protein